VCFGQLSSVRVGFLLCRPYCNGDALSPFGKVEALELVRSGMPASACLFVSVNDVKLLTEHY